MAFSGVANIVRALLGFCVCFDLCFFVLDFLRFLRSSLSLASSSSSSVISRISARASYCVVSSSSSAPPASLASSSTNCFPAYWAALILRSLAGFAREFMVCCYYMFQSGSDAAGAEGSADSLPSLSSEESDVSASSACVG